MHGFRMPVWLCQITRHLAPTARSCEMKITQNAHWSAGRSLNVICYPALPQTQYTEAERRQAEENARLRGTATRVAHQLNDLRSKYRRFEQVETSKFEQVWSLGARSTLDQSHCPDRSDCYAADRLVGATEHDACHCILCFRYTYSVPLRTEWPQRVDRSTLGTEDDENFQDIQTSSPRLSAQ